ncbi:succinylglutamate desuccinylase/aspartoacylase family protein [Vibrio sp. 10N.261.46.E11]|uniref:succinylglutamate desuccinylase/aspartoacylase family protein n=1 Tax=unclassified Vibrio TaxID=2614977 RepID=UPI001EFDC2D5|nr:succinylglutamate desuccinylase/aspartoacylase family protein [Vibrio sp. Isolate34]MCG9639051.1 succinylglutamate desuccinylase/aspartoacylase family protein [Vibrio sp. Isolate34]
MSDLCIGTHCVLPGERMKIALPVAKLYTDGEVSLPVYIMRAKLDGPTIFVSAAVHGDELNGIEIVHRIINMKRFKVLRGSIIFVPMVNVHGVIHQSRYLPDRRDLNRSFPGSPKGSLAARVANIFRTEIIEKCQYGIDLHTGAIHRTNLPQIRANVEDEITAELANAFGAPLVLHSKEIDGSLRDCATHSNTKVLVFEGGEALRFDEASIRMGTRGVIRVLRHLNMISKGRRPQRDVPEPVIARGSQWVRGSASGIVKHKYQLGDYVKRGDQLATISSAYGEELAVIIAPRTGVIIGKQNIPLIQEGEAMYHIAYFDEDEEIIAQQIDKLSEDVASREIKDDL